MPSSISFTVRLRKPWMWEVTSPASLVRLVWESPWRTATMN